uniref:Uncharacterized protein n=1 Tax=Panagrolaimus sp. ES5 TaxID=591445 RepID=A0AC34G3X7_9BILA
MDLIFMLFLLSNTNDRGEVKVQLNQKCLEKFVQFHNHFPSATAPKDIEWTNAFFREMPENEFKELCRQADFLDSQRFIEAAGDFAVSLVEQNDVLSPRSRLAALEDEIAVEKARDELLTLQLKNDAMFRGRHPQ